LLRSTPWAPLAGSLRAGQARGLRSQARFAQGRPVGSARRLASRRAGDEGSIQLLVIGARVADPSQAQDDIQLPRTRNLRDAVLGREDSRAHLDAAVANTRFEHGRGRRGWAFVHAAVAHVEV